jgi:hypothetical protein
MTGLLLRSRADALAAEPVSGDAWLARIADLPEGGYDLLAEFSNDAGARTARVAASPLYLAAVPTSAQVGGLVWRALVAQDGAVHFDAHPPEVA